MRPSQFFLVVMNLSFAILLLSLICGAEASYVCQGKCEDIPDCDAFCKRVGFVSGNCMPPLYQYCCCQTG
ncbi:hypothetical protein Hanom_Chr14g01268251 [Helianthus anomalus]